MTERKTERVDLNEDPFDGWGYMPESDHCDYCGATEGLAEVSVGYERLALLCEKHRDASAERDAADG